MKTKTIIVFGIIFALVASTAYATSVIVQTGNNKKLNVQSTTDGLFGIDLRRSGVSTDHNTWTLWNMDGSYGHDFEIWQYPLDSSPSCCIRRLEIQDDGDTVLAPSGGKVGIGTDSPTKKLEVNGAAKVNGALTWTNSYTTYNFNSGSGTIPSSAGAKFCALSKVYIKSLSGSCQVYLSGSTWTYQAGGWNRQECSAICFW